MLHAFPHYMKLVFKHHIPDYSMIELPCSVTFNIGMTLKLTFMSHCPNASLQ